MRPPPHGYNDLTLSIITGVMDTPVERVRGRVR